MKGLLMFEQTLIAAAETKRERTIALALVAQIGLVAMLGLLPFLGIQPLGPMKQFLALPPMRLGPKPPVQSKATQRPSRTTPLFNITSVRPRAEHAAVVSVQEVGPPSLSVGSAAGPSGQPTGVPYGEIGIAPPKPPPPAVKAPAQIHLTSTVAQSQLVYGPKPRYPQLAIISRSEGTVKLQAIISREGKIENLHALSGPALLVAPAMEAVQTWRYRPLLLNGEPVEVNTEIDVVFTLQR
jgi:protein TonB